MSQDESSDSSSSSYVVVRNRPSDSQDNKLKSPVDDISSDDEMELPCISRRSSMALDRPGRAPLQRHNTACQLCLEEIRGERWLCLECRGWSLCSSCFHTVSNEVHPLHTFVRARSSDDVYKAQTKMTETTPIVHLDVLCSSCQCPILGIRYECIADECQSLFNLCQRCESLPLQNHKPSHPMIKYSVPKERVSSSSILFYNQQKEESKRRSFELKNKPIQKSVKGLWDMSSAMGSVEDVERMQKQLCMEITFDKETPWGSRVAPSATFSKSWDITNKGSQPWPKGTTVSRISPAKFSPSYFSKRIVSDDVVVVGRTVEIRFVDFKAPAEGGTHIEVWALTDCKGRLFGERLEIRIYVGEVDKHVKDRYFGLKEAMQGVKEGQETLARERSGSVGGEPYRMLIKSSSLAWKYDQQTFNCTWQVQNTGRLAFPTGCRIRRLRPKGGAMLSIDDSNAYISVPNGLQASKEVSVEVLHLKLLPLQEDRNVKPEDQSEAQKAVTVVWFNETWAIISSEGLELGERFSFAQSFLCSKVYVGDQTKLRLIPTIYFDENGQSRADKRSSIKSYGDNHTIEISEQ